MDPNSNNTKSIKRKVVDQLVQGYEFATQLQLLLSHQHSSQYISQTRIVSGDLDPVDELIAKILSSFHKTISVLDSCDSVPMAVKGSPNASRGDDLAAPVSCNGGDSGDSRKRLGVGKGKRGCYTRKKRWHTWTVEASRIDEDKYAWRKYGQKEILNSKFPSDQTQANTEPNDHGVVMDSDNALVATVAQDHVNANIQEQEQENDISSLIVVGAGMVKEEDNNNGDQDKNYCEGSSVDGDLSLAWQDVMMMFDDHQHHQNHYYQGETSTASHQFSFIDNDQLFSLFDPYCPYEGTNAI
uniref:WRKY transcription factor 54 n=1 Tax=Brassica campestris TaxID=3711 RepID=V5RH20_BRACM|nr:WRKY transcription factor 54 [Brassica rapa]